MVDATMIGGALASLQTAFGISKTLLELRDSAMIQTKVIELQREILSAQQGALAAQQTQLATLAKVSELEKEIAGLKAWDAEKQKYELKEVARGSFAYALKKDARGAEPDHQICANCYNQGRKSLLQTTHFHVGRATALVCHGCAGKIYTGGFWHIEHESPPGQRRR